jgi:hypothetical protein
MNCKQFQALWTEWQSRELNAGQAGLMADHGRNCADCRHYNNQMATLLDLLGGLPAPAAASAGFSQKLFSHVRTDKIPRSAGGKRHYAIAAALLIGFTAGLLVQPALSPPKNTTHMTAEAPAPRIGAETELHVHEVSLPLKGIKEVRVAINTRREISDAILTLELPSGVEIAGYPNQRQLRWQTGLKNGRNHLTLPLRAYQAVADGVLKARVDYDGRQQELTVILNTSETEAAAPTVSTTLALLAVPVCNPQSPQTYQSSTRKYRV